MRLKQQKPNEHGKIFKVLESTRAEDATSLWSCGKRTGKPERVPKTSKNYLACEVIERDSPPVLTLLAGQHDGHDLACKKAGRWLVGGDHLTGALTSCTSSCYQHHLHHP